MPQGIRIGIICQLPKPGKDPKFISNRRGITILNCDRRVLAQILAIALGNVLPSLIQSDQVLFVKGRYILDHAIFLKLLMELVKLYPDLIDGAILFLDFEKAFDLVLRYFIIRVLRHLKFGKLYIKAVKLILSSIEAVVMLNGHMSESFTPESGTPQRCPLSPGLFILVIEVLACALRAAKGDGLRCGTLFRSSMQAADDTAVLGRTPEALVERVAVVTLFCKAAGMRIN